MKPRTRLHCAARKARRALQVGRTPSCWKALVDQKTRKVERTRQLCTWAEKPTLPPKLRPQPLFGSCLESLTVANAAGSEQAEKTSPQAPAEVGFPWQAGAKTPPARSQQAADQATRRHFPLREVKQLRTPEHSQAHRALVPLSLDRRIQTDLLGRLAGVVLLASRGRRRPSLEIDRQIGSGRSSKTPRPLPAKTGAWLPLLAQRLQSTLIQAASQLRFAGEAGTPGVTLEQALLPSWAAVLSGSTAPFSLLARLAGLPQGDALSSPGSTRVGGTPARSAVTSPAAAGSQRALQSGEPPATERPAAGHQPAIEPEHGQPDGLALPQAHRSEFTPLAPPAATTSLPPLAAPQRPYDPTLPVAAATLRYSAQQEVAETTPEDLIGLAAKIKRILDDEARRQGINV